MTLTVLIRHPPVQVTAGGGNNWCSDALLCILTFTATCNNCGAVSGSGLNAGALQTLMPKDLGAGCFTSNGAAKLRWRPWRGVVAMGTSGTCTLSSAHLAVPSRAIPKAGDVLQRQGSLKNTRCFLLKSSVLDVPLVREPAPLQIVVLTVPL